MRERGQSESPRSPEEKWQEYRRLWAAFMETPRIPTPEILRVRQPGAPLMAIVREPGQRAASHYEEHCKRSCKLRRNTSDEMQAMCATLPKSRLSRHAQLLPKSRCAPPDGAPHRSSLVRFNREQRCACPITAEVFTPLVRRAVPFLQARGSHGTSIASPSPSWNHPLPSLCPNRRLSNPTAAGLHRRVRPRRVLRLRRPPDRPGAHREKLVGALVAARRHPHARRAARRRSSPGLDLRCAPRCAPLAALQPRPAPRRASDTRLAPPLPPPLAAPFIEVWREVFPPEQLLVVRYETLLSDPRAQLERVFRHTGLGLDRLGAAPVSPLRGHLGRARAPVSPAAGRPPTAPEPSSSPPPLRADEMAWSSLASRVHSERAHLHGAHDEEDLLRGAAGVHGARLLEAETDSLLREFFAPHNEARRNGVARQRAMGGAGGAPALLSFPFPAAWSDLKARRVSRARLHVLQALAKLLLDDAFLEWNKQNKP